MFAGPNGSGKSTLKARLEAEGVEFGCYLNADDIARTLTGEPRDVARRAQQSVREQRDRALRDRMDYCWETVMSHPSHIEHLLEARVAGYATRLIYVATDDPQIAIGRVAQRVADGGHDVPLNRIVDRYVRSLALLPDVLRTGTPARLYDNSSREEPFRLVARSTGSRLQFELPRENWPTWFDRLTRRLDARLDPPSN